MHRLALAALALVAFAAAAADGNPAPTSKLAGYTKYELRDLAMGPPYAGQKSNEAAAAKLRELVATRVAPLIETWNREATPASQHTLIIEPRIEQIRFISGGKRFWGGAMAGAWSRGAHDNSMPERVISLMSDYLAANYPQAVGGRNGREP